MHDEEFLDEWLAQQSEIEAVTSKRSKLVQEFLNDNRSRFTIQTVVLDKNDQGIALNKNNPTIDMFKMPAPHNTHYYCWADGKLYCQANFSQDATRGPVVRLVQPEELKALFGDFRFVQSLVSVGQQKPENSAV